MITKALSPTLSGAAKRMCFAFFAFSFIVITIITTSNAQPPASSCEVSVAVSTSQASVAVGQEFDLTVTLTNNSADVLHAFDVTIGNLTFVDNPDGLDEISFMEQFHVLDSNHPKGRVSVQTFVISYGNPNLITSYLKWFGLPNLSHEWIQPRQTATLKMRLRAVGKAGTINIPAQYTSSDCYDTDTVQLTIAEGELEGPLLVQKTLLANDLYECIRLGEEVTALWQVMNTSAAPRYIRFKDVIPGYLPSSVSAPVLLSASTASAESGMSFIDQAYGFQADGEVATLQSELILLPPYTTLYFTDIYDVSAYASPSALSSTFYVWETDCEGIPALQPSNVISFTNTPIQVCAPLVTKTAVGDYCDVEGEATITYQVDVDRIIWGSIFAYTMFEDQYPSGTSYLPIAEANGADQLYEYTTRPGSTLWALGGYEQKNVEIPLVYIGNNPLFFDKLQLSYRIQAGNIDGSELVNTFTVRNGSVYNLDNISIGKRAVLGEARSTPRRVGDFLRAPQHETAKLANGFNYPDITSYYNTTLVTETASHSLLAECITVTYTIDGYKFDDLNGNGVRDSGEPGVESWMIVAQSSAGTFTAVTDANGYYRIEDLPAAVWQVRESYQLGWVQSAPSGEGFYNVQLGEQVQTARLDFGNWRPSNISGIKYTDIDGSGRRNKFEPKIEGVHIELRDLSGTVVQHTQTDGDGIFSFEDIAPGHYAVRESGNTDTRQSQPGPQEGGFYYIVATSGSAHPRKDFGNYVPVSISGTVSEAVGKNVDGSTEEHDATVRDFRQLKVQLQRMGPNASNEPSKVASDAIELELDEKGTFGVGGLQPGDWQVSMVLAEYWNAATENPVDVFIPSGGSATVDFSVLFDRLAAPEVTTSSITGSVFRNTTADHLYNKASDVMVSGHGVRLAGKSERGAGVDRTTTTGTDGSFRFVDLPAGEYVVSLSGVADTLRQGWPWVEAHRVILGEDQHMGATFAGQESANPPAPVDADLPWKFSSAGAYANLTTRIDDNDDGKADRRNFFSGPAALVRTSAPGASPMTVAHSSLRMAGTDSLGRTILANGLSGGSVGVVSSATRPGAMALWIQAIDIVFDLEGTVWYGPTATNASNVPAIVAQLPVSQWLSLYTAAEFAAQAGNAPVIREPFGKAVATVLGTSYVFTPGVDFGLTPKRFFPTGGGTGSGSGGVGTNDPGDRADVPLDFTLGTAYPNPFNPSTVIPFELAAAGQVRLAVYDINGRQVAVLVNNTMGAGRHSIAWDASGLPSGVYMVQLSAGGKMMTGKATLLK